MGALHASQKKGGIKIKLHKNKITLITLNDNALITLNNNSMS